MLYHFKTLEQIAKHTGSLFLGKIKYISNQGIFDDPVSLIDVIIIFLTKLF